MSEPKTVSDPDLAAVLRDVCAGVRPWSAAAKHGVDPSAIASWAEQQGVVSALEVFRLLAAAQSRVLLEIARCDAVRGLRRLSRDTKAKDTARKACVDLLAARGVDLAASEGVVSGGASRVDPEPVGAIADEDAVLSLLEKLGGASQLLAHPGAVKESS